MLPVKKVKLDQYSLRGLFTGSKMGAERCAQVMNTDSGFRLPQNAAKNAA